MSLVNSMRRRLLTGLWPEQRQQCTTIRKTLLTGCWLVVLCPSLFGAPFSSNLPIIVLDTHGQVIRNASSIVAEMGIIDNGRGAINRSTDPFNDYHGKIAIEIRGSSGQWQKWPKEQYGFETQDDAGANRNVSLLGLPPENDWILYPPYSDKSLIRNVLAYRLSRDIGRYAPRTRFCELVLNGDYRGVYVLVEKIKRDKNRVNIAKLQSEDLSGDALTGGYIVKVDRRAGEVNEGWLSPYRFSDKGDVEWLYHHPKPSQLTPEQREYIKTYVIEFERLMARSDWEREYERFFDVEAFIDYFLLNELYNNIDTYTFSTFFYKDRDSKGGRLTIGPVWDINLGFGNANYFVGMETEGWLLGKKIEVRDRIPFWLKNLFESRNVRERTAHRWAQLRKNELTDARLFEFIDACADTLAEAQKRNFERWPILGQYIWPNVVRYDTWEQEIDYLKDWLIKRTQWMDRQLLPMASTAADPEYEFVLLGNFPNPFNAATAIAFELADAGHVSLAIFDLNGRRAALLIDQWYSAGRHQVMWDGSDHGRPLAGGLYFYRIIFKKHSQQKCMLLLR